MYYNNRYWFGVGSGTLTPIVVIRVPCTLWIAAAIEAAFVFLELIRSLVPPTLAIKPVEVCSPYRSGAKCIIALLDVP